MRRFQPVAALMAGVWLTAGLALAAEKAVSVETKVKTACLSCHGPTGDSVSPTYPRINGQSAEYLAAQLKAFRSRGRDDTHARSYMWAVARGLDDKMIADLAKYYAGMEPTAAQTGGALAAEGEKLYLNGAPARGIVACLQCHGKNGEGMGSFPRIAGQHAAYFRMVMGAFRSGLRKSDIMGPVSKNLTDREIETLSSYLSND